MSVVEYNDLEKKAKKPGKELNDSSDTSSSDSSDDFNKNVEAVVKLSPYMKKVGKKTKNSKKDEYDGYNSSESYESCDTRSGCNKNVDVSVKLSPHIKREDKCLDYKFEVPFTVKFESNYSCKIKRIKDCEKGDQCKFVLFSTVNLKPAIEYEKSALTQTKEFFLAENSSFKILCLNSSKNKNLS